MSSVRIAFFNLGLVAVSNETKWLGTYTGRIVDHKQCYMFCET